MNYKAEFRTYDTNTAQEMNPAALGYEFINAGNCDVYINELKLPPGASWKTFHPGAVDVTPYRFRFVFNPNATACSSQNAALTVITFVKQ